MRMHNDLLNYNELFILVTIFAGYTLLFLLPKRFSRSQTLLAVIIGIYFDLFFDNVLCVQPFNFYAINDTAHIETWDYLSQLMFGPFAYFFFYGCSMLRQTRWNYFIYTAIWSLFAIFSEAVSWHAGVYHYLNNYQMFYSLPIYLFVLTLSLIIYLFLYRDPSLKIGQLAENKSKESETS